MSGFVLCARDGSVREVARGDPAAAPQSGFVWEHIDLADGSSGDLASDRSDLPDIARSALVAFETRPRCDEIAGGALINLRGLATQCAPDGDRLVSIRAWVHENRVLSVSRRTLAATGTVAEEMRAGAIRDPGDLVAAFARAISAELDPDVAALGDRLDDCESRLEAANVYTLRRRIARLRSEAIAFRRFIAPDRDALVAMANLRAAWLADDDRLHIREAADRFARMAEELEAVRERAALLHEQITDLRSELIDHRSLMIAIVAFVFLPLTFVTGLLGMNVTGIPFAHQPWAFWGVVAFCLAVGLAIAGWFGARNWLGK